MKLLVTCAAVVIALGMQTEVGRAAEKPPVRKLRHVVCVKFKDGVSKAQSDRIIVAFAALPSKIPQIREFEFGANNSPEGLNKGFTHCFILTFDTEKDRDAYLPHASHQEFVKIIKPVLDEVLVIDYWQETKSSSP